MTFIACMEAAGLGAHVRPGLKALGRSANKIQCAKPRLLTGSVALE